MLGFPGGSDGKESACNAEDLGSISGLERSPGGGNGNLLQYSCQENPMDRGAWRATVHEAAETQLKRWSQQGTGWSKVAFVAPRLVQLTHICG